MSEEEYEAEAYRFVLGTIHLFKHDFYVCNRETTLYLRSKNEV
jgi:hypothetical protein